MWNRARRSGVDRGDPSSVEGRPLDDRDLIARARTGDVRAYEELVVRYQQIAVRTAYLLCGSAADAEDAAQSAFVKAWRSLDRVDPGRAFRPWLLRIVANETHNVTRASRRRGAAVLRLAQHQPSGGTALSPEGAVVATEAHERLLAALNRLSETDRLVICCRYLLELSEAETAAAMACARGTVKSRLSRALRRLRALLPDQDRAALEASRA